MKRPTLTLFTMVVLLSGCQQNAGTSYDADWEAQQKRTRAQLDDYDRQSVIVDEHQKKTTEHIQRFDALLNKWEEQARRYDAILEAMEKQNGLKK